MNLKPGRSNWGGSLLVSALSRHTNAMARQPKGKAVGLIMEDFSLTIEGFVGQGEAAIRWQAGEYFCDRRLKGPADFMATTIDGVHGYTTRAGVDDDAALTVPVMAGLGAGEHEHIGVGSHSHGDAQGGATGASTITITGDGSSVHYHRVVTPTQYRPLQPGDRVCVDWIGETPSVEYVLATTLDIATTNATLGQWEA